jgi:hypothetical protein
MSYVRTVNTASNATAVQIVYSSRRGSREIEHIGSAHTAAEVEILKTIARQRMHANQDALDFGDGQPRDEEAPIVSSRARHLWEVLCTAYGVLGLDQACCQDEVFKLARARDRMDQQARQDHALLPQRRGPDRGPHPPRRHAPRQRRPRRPQGRQDRSRWTLI